MIPISRPQIGQEELDAVVAVLRSGNLRFGEVGRRFEAAFLEVEGGRASVAVNSGTAALHCVYAALLEPGDEVLVPAFTFVATASMLLAVGARPVFCDVDPDTFVITPEEIRRRVTERTRAVVPVHLYGNPVPIDATLAAARDLGLRVVWDAAQSQGATSGGKRLGEAADAVCYSFYPSKNMTTAEGGMVVVSDPALEKPIRQVSDHGREAKYSHGRLGFNYRLTDVAAAFGLAQLARVEGWVARRREIAAAYRDGLASVEGVALMKPTPGGVPAYNQFTIRLDAERFRGGRDAFVEALRGRGIGADVHYPIPLHRQPVFASLGVPVLPVAEDLAGRVLSLPIHPGLSASEVDRVVEAVGLTARDLAR